jgi:DME family drug/metabolite transporter
VAALGLTLAGVVLVVAGDLRGVRTSLWHLGGVFSAFASGVAITSIRAVRRSGADGPSESSWTVFASFTGLGLLATLPAVFGPFGRWVTPAPFDWVLILVVGVLSVIAQLIMTEALEHLTGTTMGIIHQLTVVVAMALGILFLGERLTTWSAAGSALTIAGVVWTALAAGQGRR